MVNPALPKPADWGAKPEHFTDKGRLKVWGASNAHINCSRVIFIEGDGGLPDVEQQLVLHKALPITAHVHGQKRQPVAALLFPS